MAQQPQEQFEPQPEAQGEEAYGLYRCARHPDTETGLACGKCGTYICPLCMVPTSVGARCRDCAHMTRLPTYDVQPGYMLRAMVVGGVTGIVVGVVWGVLLGIPVPFLPWLASIGAGWIIAEAISLATNRKRGQTLSIIAGASVAVAVISMVVLLKPSSLVSWVLVLVFGALAAYIAITRVR